MTDTYPAWLPEPLEPVVARLARVDDCIAEMGDLSSQWSLGAMELKQMRRSDGRVRMVVADVRPIPPAISLLFSEAVNHLRATLDNVVWHLVTERMGALDDVAATLVAMPIYAEEARFTKWAARVVGKVPELGDPSATTHQRAKALQPFVDDASVPSISSTLAVLMGTKNERVHPLLLLQGYSNLDKHRAISLMVGRASFTDDGQPFLAQDRAFREITPGTRVAPDTTWGEPVMIDASAAVMVERPSPSTTAVSPATEIQRLRDWVREQALPWLITGAKPTTPTVPVTIELGDDGRTLRERIAAPRRRSGAERLAGIHGRRLLEAATAPLMVPTVIDEEFDD